MYNQHITPLLYELKKMGIDLKRYFNSPIAYFKIDENNTKFDAFHSNLESKIISSDEKSLQNVLLNPNNLFQELQNKENETKFKIEYYIVRMKEDIGMNNKSNVSQIIVLIDELSDFDLTYLEIESLQVIIDFKWDTYTKKFF